MLIQKNKIKFVKSTSTHTSIKLAFKFHTNGRSLKHSDPTFENPNNFVNKSHLPGLDLDAVAQQPPMEHFSALQWSSGGGIRAINCSNWDHFRLLRHLCFKMYFRLFRLLVRAEWVCYVPLNDS